MSQLALVTGGTRGIGASISLELKSKGYRVIANFAKNKNTAKQFSEEYSIESYGFDVSDEGACRDACKEIVSKHGPIDILVHNAGITADSSLLKMTNKQWQDVMETNLSSCFYLTKIVLDDMRRNSFGRLIYLSSVNAMRGQRGQANYAASKAALTGFAKSVALEVAHKGITVNLIAPGYIDTEMVRSVPATILDNVITQIPVGRLGRPEEIAHIVSFLCDTRSGFITGTTIHANGGMH